MNLVLLVFYRYTSKDEPPRVLSEDEMNRLGARIVKAELMGDMVMSLKNCHNLLKFFFKVHSDLIVKYIYVCVCIYIHIPAKFDRVGFEDTTLL